MTNRGLEGLERPSSLERDLLPVLAARGELAGYEYDGFFIDIGLPETLKAADKLVPRARRRPAAFLDRDGVLNIDSGYTHSPDGLEWVEGARETVKRLNDAGYFVFVVTNQAGVAKGLYEESAVVSLHRWMAGELAAFGATVDDWRYCPYHPEGTIEAYARAHPWRKPEPGMLEDLMNTGRSTGAQLPRRRSRHDIQAAEAAGIPGHLFGGGDLGAFLRAWKAPGGCAGELLDGIASHAVRPGRLKGATGCCKRPRRCGRLPSMPGERCFPSACRSRASGRNAHAGCSCRRAMCFPTSRPGGWV